MTSWARHLLDELEASGQTGAEAARYIRERGIQLGLRDQPTAARWKLGRKIELHPRYVQGKQTAPYALSLVVHEIQHLKQGPMTALSVYGELDAWQVQFKYLIGLPGSRAGFPGRAPLIDELLTLPLGWDRSVLRRARSLMWQYAGRRYRIDILPLYPFHQELLYAIAHRRPSELGAPRSIA